MDWYVLKTQPLLEERAARELNRHNVETFLPLARLEVRLRSGLLVERLRPLFRGYIFTHLEWDTAPRNAILSTRGIKGFLGYTADSDPYQAPSTVNRQDMEELRAFLEHCNGVIPLIASRPRDVEPGDMVRVLFGPFRDHGAQVQAVHGSRVQILLRLLNRENSVTLPQECLTAAA